jgi:phage protein D
MSALPSFFTVQAAFAPLPAPYMRALIGIEVETAVGEAAAFRLSFALSRGAFGDFDTTPPDLFRPLTPIRISVALGSPLPQTVINGYVAEAEFRGSGDPGGATLDVVGMDALGTRMALSEEPATWPNLPDSEVARTIFARYGVAPTGVIPTPPTRTAADVTTTQRVNDARYLRQLAQRRGWELFVQPDPLAGIDQGYFRPPAPLQPPQGVLSMDFGAASTLRDFRVQNAMLRPTSVSASSADTLSRAAIPAIAPVATDPPMGAEPTLLRITPPPVERLPSTDAANPAEAQTRAQARADDSSRAVTATGQVDGLRFRRPLRAGQPVLVRGAGRQNSGLYYVTHVTHRISQDAYDQSFRAWRNAVGLTGAEVFVDPLAAAG